MITFFQNLILKDFWLKLFSFALASLVWIIVNIAIKKDISPGASLSLTAPVQVVFRDLPIVVMSTAQGARDFTVEPKSAMVTVDGDPLTLRELRKEDIRLLVDLSGPGVPQDGHKRIEVSAPAGAARIHVDPEEVQVKPITNH